MRRIVCGTVFAVCLGACAENAPDSSTPYRLRQALVIGPEKGGQHLEFDDDCDSVECEAARRRCGADAYAEIVLDEHAAVADVLCFQGNARRKEIGEAPIDAAEAGNNTVLVFDSKDDGSDVTGSVVLAGNNAVLYGAAADVSVIGGSLSIDKNNAIVRGVTIQGDVTIDENNARLAFSVIEGNLTIRGNSATLAECVVHGEVLILGNNTVLVQNQFHGVDDVDGKNLTCHQNHRFDDADADGSVEETELGSEIACP